MKLTSTTVLSLLALAALATVPLALTSFSAPQPSLAAPAEGPLEGAMQVLQGSTKKLDKAVEKADMAAVLTIVVDMQKSAEEAKVETPEKAETISDAKEKAAFLLAFRKQMIMLQRSLLDLEVAALDGKADDVKKIFNDTIKPMKKEAHGKFKD